MNTIANYLRSPLDPCLATPYSNIPSELISGQVGTSPNSSLSIISQSIASTLPYTRHRAHLNFIALLMYNSLLEIFAFIFMLFHFLRTRSLFPESAKVIPNRLAKRAVSKTLR